MERTIRMEQQRELNELNHVIQAVEKYLNRLYEIKEVMLYEEMAKEEEKAKSYGSTPENKD